MNELSRDNPCPRLSRIYHRSLFLTMLGSILLFAHADLSISFFFIGIIGAAIGYWYAAQGPSTISRMAINALLAIVVVLALVNALKGNFSVSSFAFFSLLLMILKLFDLRTPRDHGQILVLSLALIIASALTSNSMPTGLGVFIMGFIFLRALMLFRIFAVSTHSPTQINFTPTSSVDLRSIQTITGFVCAVGALIIFLIMPRSLGNNTLGQWGGAATQSLTTGFAEDVELGRPGRITDSPTPVLRMTVKDRNDQPVGNPNSKAIYLRGSVLTQYQSGRWIAHHDQNIPTTFRTRILERDQSLPLVSDNSRADWTREYQFMFDKPDQNYGYLFTPWKPLELRSTNTQARIGVDPATRMILLASQPINAYKVRTVDQELDTIIIPPQYTRPAVNQQGVTPRISQLATQILSRVGISPDPAIRPPNQDIQAIRALETHLRTQFKYTLVSEPVPPSQDATEWFLFERREGHCEYYASSLTLMIRSLGIPARVITGYVAAEYNEVTDSYTVRESNAHAWVEAMVSPTLWRTFDGTPQSDFHDIHEPEHTFFRRVSELYEALEQAWVTAFIGYDSDSRNAVFGDLDPNLGVESFADNLQARIATGRAQLLRQALIVSGTIFIISMTLGLFLIFITSQRIFASITARLARLLTFGLLASNAPSKSQQAADQLKALIHQRLTAFGSPCPRGTPLQTHITSISSKPDQLQEITKATEFLYHHQFTKTQSTQSSFIEQAKALIRQLR